MSEHRGEISIGKDEWLPYFDLEGRYETAVDVDFLIREASEVWTGWRLSVLPDAVALRRLSSGLKTFGRPLRISMFHLRSRSLPA
jgi:hypothetical protein